MLSRLTNVCLPSLLVISLMTTAPCHAQDWVKAMFEGNSHDFGNVPRGAKTEFKFKVTNKYEENVHIASVRSSCGCTLPRIDKADLKTYEEGAITCEFNTRSFIGAKSAVVTVVFDRPYYGEMQLMVKGNIRSDIVTEPGEIQFGDVPLGTEKTTTVRVTYAGTNQWKITDVRSANQDLGVKLEENRSPGGRIEYLMRVRLKESAKAGVFNDQIVLVTNDRNYNLVTVPVRGTIKPPLEMPVSVQLGTVRTSGSVENKILIRGNKEFEVSKVSCDDPRFEFEAPSGSKKFHIIRFKFNAGDATGAFQKKIVVETSMGSTSTVVTGNVTEQ